MLRYIYKKLFYGILVMIGVVVVVFFLFNVLPGDPARMMMGQRPDVSSIEAINKELGRDRGLHIQFLNYINDLSPISIHNHKNEESIFFLDDEKYTYITLFKFGNKAVVAKEPYLRRSYQSKRKVHEILLDAIPGTFVLAFTAMVFATIFGIFLGVVSAIKKHTWIDNAAVMIAVFGTSAPSFFVAIIMAWLFGYVLSDYTHLNMTGSMYTINPFDGEVLDLKNLILPAITLGIRPLAIIVQLTRSSMLDVMSQDYIRTAKAKGLSNYKVIVKHTLKNALNPVVTAVSGWVASLLAGSFFIEYIFGWKGIGLLTVESLEKYDFPVVMGAVLMVAVFFVIINIIVDILYGILDPRIRVQ